MTLELIGMIGGKPESEVKGAVLSWAGAPDVDREYIARFARAHEEGGFDRVLVGYGSSGPDGWSIATYAAGQTERLGFLVAHRPGFVAPTLAARKAATIDHLIGAGRIGLHIITGGSDIEQQRDGDFHDKDTRYRRTGEYLDVLRKTWTSAEPFDYNGEFYQFKGAFSGVKPIELPRIMFGGSSPAALEVGAQHADVWASYGEPLADVSAQLALVREKAQAWGRKPGLHVSLRVILGITEAKAWERAQGVLGAVQQQSAGRVARPTTRISVGSQRLQDLAAKGEIFDKRLWTAISRAGGPGGNSTVLVGTPDQVAESLVDYHEVGAVSILIRGFDPLNDAIEYGRDLVPAVRAELRRRERQAIAS